MNINRIVTSGIQEINNNINQNKIINFATKNDSFTLSNDAKFKKALKEAIEYCAESVKGDSPFESSIAIDETGKILYKNKGTMHKCIIERDKLVPNCTLIHSHPGEDLKPLSHTDIINFIETPEIKTIMAVDKNGNYCTMAKGEKFKESILNFMDVRKEVNKELQIEWLERLNIDYQNKNKYLEYYENELLKKTGLKTTDEIYEKLLMTKKPQDPQEAFDLIYFPCRKHNITILEPLEHAFIQCDEIEKVENTQKGINILRSFNQNIADRFGLDYQYK